TPRSRCGCRGWRAATRPPRRGSRASPVRADFPVSKLTPRSTSVGRGGAPGAGGRAASGSNRMRQPLASTLLPGGAGGGGGAGGDGAGSAGGGAAGSGAGCAGGAGGGGAGGGAGAGAATGQPLASTVTPARVARGAEVEHGKAGGGDIVGGGAGAKARPRAGRVHRAPLQAERDALGDEE